MQLTGTFGSGLSGNEMNSVVAGVYVVALSRLAVRLVAGNFLVTVYLCAGAAEAEPLVAVPSDGGLPNIIVTANKRSEPIGEVPASVLAITDESLGRANVQTFEDLVRVVPGLTISSPSQPANNSINIRGIGTYAYSIATQPSVAVIVDGIAQPVQAQAFSALTDVKQVEVLRGPQSTLFGKSATAGVINITTREPGDRPSADAEISATTDKQESVRASVSSPITDTLKFRFSGTLMDYRGNLGDRGRRREHMPHHFEGC